MNSEILESESKKYQNNIYVHVPRNYQELVISTWDILHRH